MPSVGVHRHRVVGALLGLGTRRVDRLRRPEVVDGFAVPDHKGADEHDPAHPFREPVGDELDDRPTTAVADQDEIPQVPFFDIVRESVRHIGKRQPGPVRIAFFEPS
jgi:hypothetical protein